jgi:hypothetical protein
MATRGSSALKNKEILKFNFNLILALLRNKKGSEKGQVALFVALVFQVLFVFFAMVINVGLLVHHKINLQNSVDLAAYYAATKQAENLNMIAHMNYQIRQSWKLLSFRYRQMGTAAYPNNPYKSSLPLNPNLPDVPTENPNPAFCITYKPFEEIPINQNSCKADDGLSIPKLQVPTIIAAFNGLNAGLTAFTQTANLKAKADCQNIGTYNWLMLARFISAYKYDVANRKGWIFTIANNMSKKKSDFLDIEGASVEEGTRQTLSRNLTSANRSKFSMELYNSLADENCGFSADNLPPKWLSDIKIAPAYNYLDSECAGASLKFIQAIIQPGSKPANLNQVDPRLIARVNYLSTIIDNEVEGLMHSSLGVEKNPWCLSYVGVKAQAQPDIPFSPFGSITISSQAFAKPFGGKIGPWYSQTWTRNSKNSDPNYQARIDKNWPIRTETGFEMPTPSLNESSLFPNYSRYMGDASGAISKAFKGQAARAILTGGIDLDPTLSLKFSFWEHLDELFKGIVPSLDILAWDNYLLIHPRIRDVEIAAIAPDQFDLTYYSVDPDFYENYLTRFNASAFSPPSGPGWEAMTKTPRGDLGSRADDPLMKNFSVRDQIEVLKTKAIFELQPPNGNFYQVIDWKHLLNSYVQIKNGNYTDFADNKFGKCSQPWEESPFKQAVPGSCAGAGGRVGYSVKILSKKVVDSGGNEELKQLSLGGEGIGEGAIINPLPKDF